MTVRLAAPEEYDAVGRLTLPARVLDLGGRGDGQSCGWVPADLRRIR